jgi:hypothetical protein
METQKAYIPYNLWVGGEVIELYLNNQEPIEVIEEASLIPVEFEDISGRIGKLNRVIEDKYSDLTDPENALSLEILLDKARSNQILPVSTAVVKDSKLSIGLSNSFEHRYVRGEHPTLDELYSLSTDFPLLLRTWKPGRILFRGVGLGVWDRLLPEEQRGREVRQALLRIKAYLAQGYVMDCFYLRLCKVHQLDPDYYAEKPSIKHILDPDYEPPAMGSRPSVAYVELANVDLSTLPKGMRTYFNDKMGSKAIVKLPGDYDPIGDIRVQKGKEYIDF